MYETLKCFQAKVGIFDNRIVMKTIIFSESCTLFLMNIDIVTEVCH